MLFYYLHIFTFVVSKDYKVRCSIRCKLLKLCTLSHVTFAYSKLLKCVWYIDQLLSTYVRRFHVQYMNAIRIQI